MTAQRVETFVASGCQARRTKHKNRNVLQVREDSEHSANDAWQPRSKKFKDTLRVLLLPGWLNSDTEHWQSHWERQFGYLRVEQSDWQWPRRGDWMARLDEVLLEDERPALLAAHSLGCHLVASWAEHSQHCARVIGALLVAPPDTLAADLPPQLHNWRPTQARPSGGPLPFPSIAVVSTNDPFCTLNRATQMAASWGSKLVVAGPQGHLNSASNLADWPLGQALIVELQP